MNAEQGQIELITQSETSAALMRCLPFTDFIIHF